MQDGGDPIMYQSIKRAVRRMSYDYQKREEFLK